MKVRNLLLMGVMGLGLTTACSNEDEVGGGTSPDENGAYAQISISIASSNSTRALSDNKSGDEVEATSEENNIKSMRIVFADANHVALYVYDPELKTEPTTGNQKDIRSTEPFEVTPGQYYVYVLANYKENANNLSPVIAGQTNMKQDFKITGILSTSDSFFMTNDALESMTTISEGEGSNTEVNDDGTEITDGKKVTLLNIKIERVVGKVTFTTNNENKFDVNVKEAGVDVKIADVQIQGVSMINLNTKMFLVKRKATGTNPKGAWTNWYYVEDPNYSSASVGDFVQTEAVNVTENSSFTSLGDNAVFYCPENTMAADKQLNGQTTGVVYKAKYTPHVNTEQKINMYTELAKDGNDVYSRAFAEVLALDGHNENITDQMFTTTPEDANGTFYEYKDLLFKNLNAALLYYVIDTNLSTESRASAINTAFGKLLETGATRPDAVHEYKDGICYYIAWIMHNPASKEAMEWGRYGVVRNHWYDLTVTGVKSLGHYEPTYKDPNDPDDPKVAQIQVQATVKKWVAVKQEVILGQ